LLKAEKHQSENSAPRNCIGKLAKFLSRSERAILAAYKQLEADGVIIAKPSHSTGTVASWVLNNLNEANHGQP
jgi:hypothetical protein